MKKAALFIINGFEETEALATADILRRGKVDLKIVSLESSTLVKSKHDITIMADISFNEALKEDWDMLIIPGGTTNYLNHEGLLQLVLNYNKENKNIAAICAAPAVFGKLGILKGKKATSFPGMESYLGEDVNFVTDKVVTDGNITTSRGPATSFYFALRLLAILEGEEAANKVKQDFLINEL